MNALVKVSTVLTNAPHLLNLDCNSKVLKEIVLYNGPHHLVQIVKSELPVTESAPQCWYRRYLVSPHTKVEHHLCLSRKLCSYLGSQSSRQ